MDFNFALPANLSLFSFMLLALIMALSGLMSGLSGFGFSAIGAISLTFLQPTLAVPLLMALSTANQLLSMSKLRADMKSLNRWGPRGPAAYVVGGMIGAPIGLWILQTLSVTALMITFGLFLMTYAAYSIIKPATFTILPAEKVYPAMAIGGIGGIIGGFTAAPATVVVAWSELIHLPKAEARSIVQPYIIVMQVFSLILLAIFSPACFDKDFATLFMLLLPIVLPCTLIGTAIYRRLSEFSFRRIALLLLGSSGLGIFIKGFHTFKPVASLL